MNCLRIILGMSIGDLTVDVNCKFIVKINVSMNVLRIKNLNLKNMDTYLERLNQPLALVW